MLLTIEMFPTGQIQYKPNNIKMRQYSINFVQYFVLSHTFTSTNIFKKLQYLSNTSYHQYNLEREIISEYFKVIIFFSTRKHLNFILNVYKMHVKKIAIRSFLLR